MVLASFEQGVDASQGIEDCGSNRVKDVLQMVGEQALSRADLYRDPSPRRKRTRWKKKFLDALLEAGRDIGEITEEDLQRMIRDYRAESCVPKITVDART